MKVKCIQVEDSVLIIPKNNTIHKPIKIFNKKDKNEYSLESLCGENNLKLSSTMKPITCSLCRAIEKKLNPNK